MAGLGLACRLGRAWTQPTGLQAPTTRTARGATAPCCQDIPLANEKSQVTQMRYLTFLAGAEGLEPSARGFGVDVRTAHKEQGRAGVVRFFSQERERVVLIWCCGKTFRGKAVFKSPLLEGLPPRDRIHITHRGLNRHRRLGHGFLLYPRRPYR